LEELSEGRIVIDGVNVKDLPLKVLRSNISIIPQEPTLFTGTLRMNLDPFDEYSDQQIWDVLEKIQLKETVAKYDEKLNFAISESTKKKNKPPLQLSLSPFPRNPVWLTCCSLADGSNLSVGERQLVCMGRALLRGSKIVCMDEATAALDWSTEQKIQHAISTAFENSTVSANSPQFVFWYLLDSLVRRVQVLCIAHRLATVMNYDRVLVLHLGQVVEFDNPQKLLDDPKSQFFQMVQKTTKKGETLD
jgi:ABC-type multidrug transport system fused ATPase/permease subunit